MGNNAMKAASQVLNELCSDKPRISDRRASRRFPYLVVQRFAPVLLGRLPDLEIFRPMLCRDLSNGGISFFWPIPPSYGEVVVEIGKAPDLKYFKAKIVNRRMADPDMPEYVIHCQFAGCVF